jgi:hypothetical protein
MFPSSAAPPGLSVQMLKGTNPKLTPPVKVYVCQNTCNKAIREFYIHASYYTRNLWR